MSFGARSRLTLPSRFGEFEADFAKLCEDVDSILLIQGSVTGFCEYCNEISGSTKVGEFFGQLRNCKLLNSNSPSWSYF
jgi:hypothetical protein